MDSKKLLKNMASSIVLSGLLIGCGGGGGTTTSSGASGGGAKGPFKDGSSVTAYQLDLSGARVGGTEHTTSDDKGKFTFASLPWTGPTEFNITGDYYNEVTGKYNSGGDLSAIVNIDGTPPSVNINILTNMEAGNIKSKMSDGVSIATAKQEAQEAIAKTFNIDLDGASLEDLDLTEGTGTNASANAQLLQLSAAILSTSNPEEVLSNLADDLKDGEVDEEALASLEEVTKEIVKVDVTKIAEKMKTKLDLSTDVPQTESLAGTLALNHAISFDTIQDAEISTDYEATTIVSGIVGANSTTISIDVGTFEISSDDGSTWATETSIENGNLLRVKNTSSGSFSEAVTSVVTIGGSKIPFIINTKADTTVSDTTPNDFDFGFKDKQETSGSSTSDEIKISGINARASISVDIGTLEVSMDDGSSWIPVSSIVQASLTRDSSISYVENGNLIRVTHTTASELSSSVTSTVTIGGVEGTFTSFTQIEDKTPDTFSFQDKVGQDLSETSEDLYILSELITISGTNTATDISISGGEYSINGGPYTSVAGTISSDNTLQVRLVSSSENDTKTVSTLTLGNTSLDFTSTTKVELEAGNELPIVILASTASVDEDNNLIVNITVSDDNLDTITVSVDEAKGIVSEVSDTQFTFVPDANFHGDAIVSVVATDEEGAIVTKYITITVNQVNDAPSIIVQESAIVNEDNTLVIDFIADDIDEDNLTFVNSTATNGTVEVEDGEISYTPNANYNGSDTIILTISDGTVDVVKNISVSVTPVNDAPLGVDDIGLSTAEDTALTMSSLVLNDTDVENDTLTISAVSNPQGGTVAIVGNNVVFTPTANYSGAASFEYTVNDGTIDSSSTATVGITISSVNDAPIANSDTSESTDEDTQLTIAMATLLSNDTDSEGDTLVITEVSNPQGGTAVISGTNIIFTPTANYNGDASFDYKINDGIIDSAAATVSFTVNAVNDAPIAVSDASAGTTPEDTALTIAKSTLLSNDTDIDGNSLDIVAVSNPQGGTVSIVGSDVVFTPTANYSGPASFDYTVNDGTVDSSEMATVGITITSVNDAPIANDDMTESTDEDTALTISMASLIENDTDSEGDTLSISAVSNPQGGTAVISGTDIIFTPTANYNGSASFDYIVNDGTSNSVATATVGLTVDAVNDAPVATNNSFSINVNTAKIITFEELLTADIDGDDLEIIAIDDSGTAGTVVLNTNQTITYTPVTNADGVSDSFTYTISDGTETATATVTMNIQANDAPVAVDDSGITTDEDTAVTIAVADLLANDTDANSDILSLSAVMGATNGTAELVGTNVIFTPEENYNGSAMFSYTVTDGLATDTGLVTLAITSINDKPVIEDISISVVQNSTKSGTLSVTDVDNTPSELSFLLVSNSDSSKGSVTINSDGSYTFTPTTDAIGAATFTYKVNDGMIDSDTKTVTINILKISDVKSVIPTDISWDNDNFDLWTNLDSSNPYSSLTGLDTTELTSKTLFEFEGEIENDKRTLWLSKNIFDPTSAGFDWKFFELENGSFISSDDPVLGVDKVTVDGNELVLNSDFKDYRIKYLGEIDANSFNDSTNTIFGDSGKAYGLAIQVIGDSYGFDEKVRNWDEPTETYYTTIDNFISTQTGSGYFQRHDDGEKGLAFADGSSGNTGTLVESDGSSVINPIAGTWEIVTVSGIEILKIIPTLDGYDKEEELTIFTEHEGLLYRGWMDKAGQEFGTYFLGETAKNDLVSYYENMANTIEASSLVGKKIVNKNETYYFKVNGEVLIGDVGSDYTKSATYTEESDGTIKVLFDDGEYDIITKEDYDYSAVSFEYATGSNVLEESESEAVNSPIDYSETDSDYVAALTDNPEDTNMVAVDPYIVGAQFCYDENINGNCDENEQVSTLTNENGQFTFSPGLEDGSKVIMLGDTKGKHLGESFVGLLKGEVGNPIASPLTTLIGNGFTPAQVVGILTTAGITLSEADLEINPMSAFEGMLTESDYPLMQAVVAVNMFLNINSYGLTYNDWLANQATLAPILEKAVTVIQSSINSSNIPEGAEAKYVVYIGVAISNYLVKQVSSDPFALITYNPTTHIMMLAAAYSDLSNIGKIFKISDDGNSAVETATVSAIEFTEYGYDFVEKKSDAIYNVVLGSSSNNVVHDDGTNLVTMTAYKSDFTESRSSIKTRFDDRQKTLKASVKLSNSLGGNQRMELTGYMYDAKHSGLGIFAKVSVHGNKLYYWVSKDTYDIDTLETLTSNTEIDSGTIIEGDFENVGLRLILSVNPSTDQLVIKVFDSNQAQVGSTVNVDLPSGMNYGFDNSEVRVRVNQTTGLDFDNLDDSTVGFLSDFVVEPFTYTTATISSGSKALISGSNKDWIDIINFTSNTELVVKEFEDNGTYFAKTDEETITADLVDGSSSFTISESGTLLETLVITDTIKVNAYKGEVYTDLYRSTITFTQEQEDMETYTWGWNNWWEGTVNGSDATKDIDGLVDVFTNGGTYFQTADTTFMMKSGGSVVKGIYNGESNGNSIYTPGTEEVGTWVTDSDSINIDLSTNYKVNLEFSVDSNDMIENKEIYLVGYEEEDYIWTGSDKMDFFEQFTGLNVTASISGKVYTIDDGNEQFTQVFYPTGKYTERGYIINNGSLEFDWSCYGIWKEFADNTYSITCDNNSTEPINEDSSIISDSEFRLVVNGTTQTYTFAELDSNDDPTGNTETAVFNNVSGASIASTRALLGEETTADEAIVDGYTIRAYSDASISGDNAPTTPIYFDINGNAGNIIIHKGYVGEEVMLKVFNSDGKIVATTEYKSSSVVGAPIVFGELLEN